MSFIAPLKNVFRYTVPRIAVSRGVGKLSTSENPGCAGSFSTSSRGWSEKVAIEGETERLADEVEGESVICWQDGEDVEDFLTRCAPSKLNGRSRIAIKNPWDIERSEGDIDTTLATLQTPLQEAITDWNSIVVDETLNKMAKSLRKTEHKEKLKDLILTTAAQNGVTGGKWIIYAGSNTVDFQWSRIATGTYDGLLGTRAEVSGNNGMGIHVIFVYTPDFRDLKDTKRVLDGLQKAFQWKPRSIAYKPFIYSLLKITVENPYHLRPAMITSRELEETELEE
ncbi:hypothetical protein L873DRAFT_1768554 [Choiromyces venosus 120613-1]|uniref:DUF1917-domain-containing protein n=1 Tax=Choiromyces venosus 120613-1 TaxID=1336337 RepID=A0A3N4JKR7_9PEZI|nr:hypothetical protein L873DRAFT_1768554 [Choiromyces venosus 120613-1]